MLRHLTVEPIIMQNLAHHHFLFISKHLKSQMNCSFALKSEILYMRPLAQELQFKDPIALPGKQGACKILAL